ncbi:MAG TPA: hypothetical protein PLM81_00410 [Ginsengibacter sp.]|mgnify:CR=1 FL=1|nr:hypothetical protein [Ginsengibacter sp.]
MPDNFPIPDFEAMAGQLFLIRLLRKLEYEIIIYNDNYMKLDRRANHETVVTLVGKVAKDK